MSTDAHDLPEAIQWHEGMLLAPHHFQQLALRQEQLLHYHTMMMQPFSWGIRKLRIDQVLLTAGTYRVLELEARMPDGLVVALGPDDVEELEIDLSEHVAQMKGGAALKVHLAVPAQRPGSASVTAELARYVSVDGHAVIDENTGEGELDIPRLRPRLTLVAGENPPSKYVSFPLAEITFRNEMYMLTEFIPPTLSVALASVLGEICSGIVRRLREKARYLSDEVQTRYFEMGSSGVLDNKQKIQSLVEPLPLLEATLYTGNAHPYLVYGSLMLVVGHVAALGSSMIPPVLPAYDHNNLRRTFDVVRDYIFQTIEEGIWETYFVIPFVLKDNVFTLRIEEAWLKDTLLVGVRGAQEAAEREVVAWMEEALIGSDARLTSMRERRILGAERRRAADDAFVAARGLMLFEVDADREFISPEEVLGILNLKHEEQRDKPLPVAEIVLLVPKKDLSKGE